MDREKLIEELVHDEGMVLHIYPDKFGYKTLGVGHLITESDDECGLPVNTPITKARALECLNRDLDGILQDLDRNVSWWRELDDNRQRVVANMCFNLGINRFLQFKKFLAALEERDYETASNEMMNSRWAFQVGERSKRLSQRMKG